jgi:hypothetical protein
VNILALIRSWTQKFSDGGIDERAIVANDCAGCQARHIDMPCLENVHHLRARSEKVVGSDPAVAAPPDCFRLITAIKMIDSDKIVGALGRNRTAL